MWRTLHDKVGCITRLHKKELQQCFLSNCGSNEISSPRLDHFDAVGHLFLGRFSARVRRVGQSFDTHLERCHEQRRAGDNFLHPWEYRPEARRRCPRRLCFRWAYAGGKPRAGSKPVQSPLDRPTRARLCHVASRRVDRKAAEVMRYLTIMKVGRRSDYRLGTTLHISGKRLLGS